MSPTIISLYHFFLFSTLVYLFHGVKISAQDNIMNIGAIINVNSHIGREEKVSMEVAVQMFNNKASIRNKLVLHLSDSGGNPLQAIAAANELIKEKKVQAIIGMETWQEAVLVAEATNKVQVPILSFAAPSVTPPFASVRWPFLIRMASNDCLQMKSIASIVGSYDWRRVIAIYEDDCYNADSGILSLLSDELGAVGSEIEHWLAFPPFSTMSNPEVIIKEQLKKVKEDKQSRVFIIVRSSLELVTHVLTQATDVGLMASDSVWITSDSVTNLLATVDSSVMPSMQGLIGIKNKLTETSQAFLSFSNEFHKLEKKFKPGVYAARVYDAVSAITSALETLATGSSRATSQILRDKILTSKFNGLSGIIQFQNMELLSRSMTYEILNVKGTTWLSIHEFRDNTFDEKRTERRKETGGGIEELLSDRVYWPGGLRRVPRGWVMPSDVNKLIIGVRSSQFKQYVKVKDGGKPTGFSIDVFNEAEKILGYPLPHEFKTFEGTYDGLVMKVYDKEFDAVVGDPTILANRSNYVEFTQPYAESGLTMVVPVKPERDEWLFLKPFSPVMWMVLSFVFAYTMFVVWFLEHKTNDAFKGTRRSQLSTSMWFTFNTIFFAHKETLRNDFTRGVMVVWLCVVFVLISSYQASLTSMLTVRRLKPTVTDIEILIRSNSTVGCDGNSFIRKYLLEVLQFHQDQIINIENEDDYHEEFRRGKIKAAFLELPYKNIFLSKYCKDYQVAGPTYRLGGLGFVFPKGSPIARDFSKAILHLTENGTVNQLEKRWFTASSECTNLDGDLEKQSLSLSNFWSLFLTTWLTSTVMLILYIVQMYNKLRRVDDSFMTGIKRLLYCLASGQIHPSHSDPVSSQSTDIHIMISSNGELMSEYRTPDHSKLTPVPESEIPESLSGSSDTHTRVLNLVQTFPSLERRYSRSRNDDNKSQGTPPST
ncbi:hypothetical protein ACHQM5_013308 [Ranunculus cassubicifolius]